jgi:hypothetical protein
VGALQEAAQQHVGRDPIQPGAHHEVAIEQHPLQRRLACPRSLVGLDVFDATLYPVSLIIEALEAVGLGLRFGSRHCFLLSVRRAAGRRVHASCQDKNSADPGRD